jgi:hypothetical protein
VDGVVGQVLRDPGGGQLKEVDEVALCVGE